MDNKYLVIGYIIVIVLVILNLSLLFKKKKEHFANSESFDPSVQLALCKSNIKYKKFNDDIKLLFRSVILEQAIGDQKETNKYKVGELLLSKVQELDEQFVNKYSNFMKSVESEPSKSLITAFNNLLEDTKLLKLLDEFIEKKSVGYIHDLGKNFKNTQMFNRAFKCFYNKIKKNKLESKYTLKLRKFFSDDINLKLNLIDYLAGGKLRENHSVESENNNNNPADYSNDSNQRAKDSNSDSDSDSDPRAKPLASAPPPVV